MKKSLYLLLGLLLVCSIYQACAPEELPGSIYGTVMDKATGEPIKSAGVELSPSGLKTVTGSEGQFEFTELDPSKYTLIITKTGYLDGVSSTIEVKPGQQAKGDVQIEKLPPALKVVDDNRQEISTLDFGSAEADVARSFSLFNDGVESLEWQITTTAEWIKSVSKKEGVLSAGATQSLIVIIDRVKLSSGENTTTVHITSNNGSKQLTITATNSTVLATLNTLAATNVKTTTATLNGEILTDGSPKYSERGFVYSESSMPTLGSCIQKVTSTLTDSKTYSATVAGLTKGNTYYVRAYAINAGKEAYSTNEVSFTPTSVLAEVTTKSVSNISKGNGTATFSGTIVSEGDPAYIERGFVYGTTNSPSIDSDTKLVVSGKGLGDFSTNVSGLKVGNVYYVRAYATNEQGTAYGKEEKADLTPTAPSVSTISVSNISRSAGTAQVTGKILDAGDPVYTARGFVYSTSSNPTLDNGIEIVVSGSGIGEYSTTISSLQVGNVYYIRAFVTNAKGTFYGTDVIADFNPLAPSVSTVSVSNISRSAGTAKVTGKILDTGDPVYTARGFVYSTSSSPTLDNGTKVIVSGSGTGEYSTTISSLQVGKVYYIRAFVTNAKGTFYGTDVIADFKPIPPQVSTASVEYRNSTSAYFIGKITNIGDPEYTERGFIYGTMQNPMIDDAEATKVTVAKTSSTQFEKQVTISGLSHTIYYVRAYAKSSAGVSYGAVIKIDAHNYLEYIQLPTFMHGNITYRVAPEFDIEYMDWNQATSMCDNLTYGGYSDWVIPTKEELNTMYINRAEIGGFKDKKSNGSYFIYYYYWSSTEYNVMFAYQQVWHDGRQTHEYKTHAQETDYQGNTFYYRTRCVRKEN